MVSKPRSLQKCSGAHANNKKLYISAYVVATFPTLQFTNEGWWKDCRCRLQAPALDTGAYFANIFQFLHARVVSRRKKQKSSCHVYLACQSLRSHFLKKMYISSTVPRKEEIKYSKSIVKINVHL